MRAHRSRVHAPRNRRRRQAVPRCAGRESADGRSHVLRGGRTDDLLDGLEQRRAGALLLSRTAVVDDQRAQCRRPRRGRIPGRRSRRQMAHEIPPLRPLI